MEAIRIPICLAIFAWAVFQANFISQCSAISLRTRDNQPNIVFFLTDDQDSELGGLTPMSKAKSWIAEKGVTFDNAFAAVPVCCPSRSSILSGLYQPHSNVVNNSLAGNCWGTEWRETHEKKTFATVLKASGYDTYYAGKYLNNYCSTISDLGEEGKDYSVPSGWDHWAGLCGNSKYYNYTLSVDGVAEVHGDNYENDYLTDIISRKAEAWLDDYEAIRDKKGDAPMNPFLMVLSTPAPHGPFTPAPQYANEFADLEPLYKTPAFNYVEDGNSRKHWVMRQDPKPLDDVILQRVDDAFRNRLRTLLSVDDMIDTVMKRLEELDVLDNTYVIFTSDHGYHLGTFSLAWDKRMPYETDVRVPFLVRGPGIMVNKTVKDINVNIDIAPTIVEMSGGTVNEHQFDGISLLPLITEQNNFDKAKTLPRDQFWFTYNGEYEEELNIDTCEEHIFGDHMMSHCKVEWDCKCEDTKNNTYVCKRVMNEQENYVLCMFEDEEDFIESYNLNDDPYQLYNLQFEDVSKDPKHHEWVESSKEELRSFRDGST